MAKFNPIIPGEVLLSQSDIIEKQKREPIPVSTDAQAFATLPVMYFGYLVLERATDLNQGFTISGAIIGSTALGLAAVTSLENRGIIETV